MIYSSLLKTIKAKNAQLAAKTIKPAEYNIWKEDIMNKMDVFLLCNRITDDQYKELMSLLQ